MLARLAALLSVAALSAVCAGCGHADAEARLRVDAAARISAAADADEIILRAAEVLMADPRFGDPYVGVLAELIHAPIDCMHEAMNAHPDGITARSAEAVLALPDDARLLDLVEAQRTGDPGTALALELGRCHRMLLEAFWEADSRVTEAFLSALVADWDAPYRSVSA